MGLSAELRASTHALHVQAERTGMMARIFHSQATRRGYALFLRNLWPVYAALEAGLERHRATPGVGRFARPETYRTDELAADLAALEMGDLAMLPAGEAYAASVSQAAEGDGIGLIGHAYTRTLGDLSGGQIMRRLLGRSLDLGEATLGFYRFAGIDDMAAYKAGYHTDLDLAGAEIADPGRVVAAAVLAFRLNIDLSAAVAAMDAGAE
jgi:heme oxygenase